MNCCIENFGQGKTTLVKENDTLEWRKWGLIGEEAVSEDIQAEIEQQEKTAQW